MVRKFYSNLPYSNADEIATFLLYCFDVNSSEDGLN